MALTSSSTRPVNSSDFSQTYGSSQSRHQDVATRRPDSFQRSAGRHSAGRPPEGQKLLNTLLHPFAPQKRRRRRAKEEARGMLRESIELIYDKKNAAAHEMLRRFIAHCRSNLLDVDHELQRGRPSDLHPVEEILRAVDYDALLVLAPVLHDAQYGTVYMNRSGSGFYIGEGGFEGSGENASFKARGHGILMRDGLRTEGEWRDNLPNGHVRHYCEDGPLRFYEGQVTNSMMHGKGSARYADGRTLRCTWENNVRAGRGEVLWPGGDHFSGVWKKGHLEPGAILDTADGRRYEGEFDEETCRPNGKCSITWLEGPQAGARYDGPVKAGKAGGTGTYMFGSDEELYGFLYEGAFFNDAKHGVGQLVELHTEKKQRCHFSNDVLKTPMPQRSEFESDDDD